jgi:dTDP-4-amino-4,6-dideoxygalactose transaminase
VADYNTIRKKRIDNYKKMLGLLKPSKNYDVMFPSIGKDTVPIAFPVLIHGNKREQVYFKLIDKKVSVFALYYRMIEQISKEKFPVSYSISNSILHFPIHQDITKDDLVYMAKTFNKIINER